MLPLSKPKSNPWRAEILSRIEASRTALLVIDLQNDFCSDNGALARLGSNVSPCKAAAERVASFLARARSTVAFIAFFRLVYDPDMMSEVQRERLVRDGQPVICAPGTKGSELFITPAPNDLVFVKHRYSAFSNDQFRQALKTHSVTAIAVTGVDTHICVEGTVREGYDLGYRMIVLSDLVATRQSEWPRHDNSLLLCERYFGVTMDSSEFLGVLHRRTTLSPDAAAL